MRKYLPLLVLLAVVALSFFGGYKAAMSRFPDISEVTDTTTVFDTIPYYKPVPKDSIVLKYVQVPVPVNAQENYADANENQANPDTATISIPIERLVYEEDSTYYAVVSGPALGGYHPSLDTLKVYSKTVTIEKTRTVTSYKPYKWSVGPFVSQEVGMDHYAAKVGVEADLGFKNDRWRFAPEVGYRWTTLQDKGWYAGARLRYDLIRKR